MSTNLGFKVVGGPGYVEFPFQTPTDLTWAVMDCGTVEERIQKVHEWIDDTEWHPEIKAKTKSEVAALMNSPHLELDAS